VFSTTGDRLICIARLQASIEVRELDTYAKKYQLRWKD
jgi:hypothetical protein